MKHRTALAALVAAASLLGTAGMAQAHHLQGDDYSPCREGQDDHHFGYSDEGLQDDSNRELPTIYANGDPSSGSLEGNIGICSGNRYGTPGQDPVRSLEIGNDADGPYVKGSSPETDPILEGVPATAATAENELGAVNYGDDYVEVDGYPTNPAAGAIPQSDGYISAGTHEHQDGPGVCMSGDNNRAYYHEDHPTWQDCNEGLVDDENIGYLTGLVTG